MGERERFLDLADSKERTAIARARVVGVLFFFLGLPCCIFGIGADPGGAKYLVGGVILLVGVMVCELTVWVIRINETIRAVARDVRQPPMEAPEPGTVDQAGARATDTIGSNVNK